ncbi:MAG: glycosyltransferase family 2 protein [Nitrospinae bacterium]|nr:glycosyltransferase family 2 protein [Nitrospinota bacterium]
MKINLKNLSHYFWSKALEPNLINNIERALNICRYQGIAALIKKILNASNRKNQTISFQDWIKHFGTVSEIDKDHMRKHIETFSYKPLVSILIPAFNAQKIYLSVAIESVRQQTYPNWELCISIKGSSDCHVKELLNEFQNIDDRIKVVYRYENGHDYGAYNSALEKAEGEWVAFLGQDDEISVHALYFVVNEINEHPEADIIYSDEDKIDEFGRRFSPHFKSDWNPDLFFSHNYISNFLACRASLIKKVGGFRKVFEEAQVYDLLLRCIKKIQHQNIRHIPRILYHRRHILRPKDFSGTVNSNTDELSKAALKEYFNKSGQRVQINSGLSPHTYRVRYSVQEPLSKVDIIIPTRNRSDLLAKCIDSIRSQTQYSNYEIIVVDNLSDDPKTLKFFENLKANNIAKVLNFNQPFNFSVINNYAASKTDGPMLCLMNNDVEVIDPHWLLEMVSHAQRPEIGAVGCKLIYPNQTIQHGGIITGILSVAGHSHKYYPADSGGYFNRLQTIQNISAVTGACLVVRRELYENVGGLEEQLEVAFNDVDFCLRIQEKGYRNLWTPYAQLIHHETLTRGYDDTPEKQKVLYKETKFMLKYWGDGLKKDPYYNPNLSLHSEDFKIAAYPNIKQPWEQTSNQVTKKAAC